MQKPARTALALAAGSLVLGVVGTGAAVADGGRTEDPSSQQVVLVEPRGDQPGKYDDRDYAVGKVVARGSLKVRNYPSTSARVIGQVKSEQRVAILCKIRGEKVDGNDLWYRLYIKNKHSDEHGDGREDDGRGDEEEEATDEGATDEEEGADDWGDSDDSADRAVARKDRGGDDKQQEKAWVSARYVKNLSTVIWCN
ncbi:SH3 domain-containing protein [Streptomyces sp. NPDC046866]|uniref:SH3 domain-containing protein n=1 Tax=Streptomyces sp. NPDC046866 TaxID=3154921 RepID=UPI003451A6D5